MAFSDERARAVEALIRRATSVAAVAALQPIPFLDAAVLTAIQHRMVRAIGRLHGGQVDAASVGRMFYAARVPILKAQTILALAKLAQVVPFAPELVSVSVACALTEAIGEVSDEYFSKRGVHVEELGARVEAISRERFEETFRMRRDELRAAFRDPGTRRRVQALKRERRDRKIDYAEEARRMDEILGRAPTRHSATSSAPKASPP